MPKSRLAHPVQDSNFSDVKMFSNMSRDELKMNLKRAVTWRPGQNPLADACLAEWNGRVDHIKTEELKAEVQAQDAEVEFRAEVIEELVNRGFARHVAANLTNTEAKLLAQAKEVGVI